MTKEDKQIIDRAVKEEWRIGDRSRLKRLLEKNLKQYRENVELERKLEQAEKDLADYQFNYPKIKELEKENAELKKELKDANEKVVHLTCNQNKDLKCKLTKAKKLLEKLLITSCNSDVLNLLPNCSEVLRVRVEAEQFLKEIEK